MSTRHAKDTQHLQILAELDLVHCIATRAPKKSQTRLMLKNVTRATTFEAREVHQETVRLVTVATIAFCDATIWARPRRVVSLGLVNCARLPFETTHSPCMGPSLCGAPFPSFVRHCNPLAARAAADGSRLRRSSSLRAVQTFGAQSA